MGKTIIHVVSANERECGKSTCALFLANSLLGKNKKAYIIDLDWNDTKWIKRFENGIGGDDYVYLTDLLYEFNKNYSKQYIQRLRINKAKQRKSKCINVCIAKSQGTDENALGTEELDLYENIIFKVISNIIDNNKSRDDTVNIILDMSSGNNDYSKRIINNLLLDQLSPLYSKYYNSNSASDRYSVVLYLVSLHSIDCVKSNVAFFDLLENKRSYSSTISKLYKDNNFQVKFIVNDIKGDVSESRKDIKKCVCEKECYIKRNVYFISHRDGLKDEINYLSMSIEKGLFSKKTQTVKEFDKIVKGA